MPKWRMTAQRRVTSSPASGQRPRGGAATCPSAWGHAWAWAGWSRAIGQPVPSPRSAAGRACRKCVTRGEAMVGQDGYGRFRFVENRGTWAGSWGILFVQLRACSSCAIPKVCRPTESAWTARICGLQRCTESGSVGGAALCELHEGCTVAELKCRSLPVANDFLDSQPAAD